MESNSWEFYIEKQKEICKKHGAEWKSISKEIIIGCSEDISSNPLNGLRHPREGNTSGWYIWSGDYSEKDDFFKPICAEHLLKKRPEIFIYLGLEPGYRFLIDNSGYEDIWYDKKLKDI